MQSIGQLLEEALLHFEKKEYVKAGKLVDELLASNPEFHRGWFLKGVILEETGRPAEAEKCYGLTASRPRSVYGGGANKF